MEQISNLNNEVRENIKSVLQNVTLMRIIKVSVEPYQNNYKEF